eukprot:SAG31_NODE_14295_length_816_cov_0.885635_2_plen_126_part_01
MLRLLGSGYNSLCMYRCEEAVASFRQLPTDQQQSGWLLCQFARAYFELVDYAKAEKYFRLMRQADPYRLAGLEIYSTLLWHLKKEVELCHLAQQVLNAPTLSMPRKSKHADTATVVHASLRRSLR